MLSKKSLTELRGIAQSFDVADIFQKDQRQLIQAIEMKQQAIAPEPKIEIPKPEYDARLMTRPPARKSDIQMIEELLTPYVARGLRLTFDENGERWFMSRGKMTDEGTVRMPPRHVLHCAERLMQ